MSIISYTSSEITKMIDHIVKANHKNLPKGRSRVALNIVGDAGLGKTDVVKQYAKNNNMGFVRLNLAEVEELGDLIGIPIQEYQISKISKEDERVFRWVPEKVADRFFNNGWQFTNKTRMSYSKPAWVEGLDVSKPSIFFLDDFSRAQANFIQATMQLIQDGKYISWSLPDNCTILLSSNPDDGEYSVQGMDEAQTSRYIPIGMKYSEKDWAKWAEGAGIDGKCINFMLLNPDATSQINSETGEQKLVVNPRKWVNFFNALSPIDNYKDNLEIIRMLGDGAVGQAGSGLFIEFINNNLDQLITPEDMLLKPTDEVLRNLRETIGTGDKYRADIAATLVTRFINFTLGYVSNRPLDNDIVTHIESLFDAQIFGADLNYNIVYNLFTADKRKFAKLLVKPSILKILN